MMMRLFSILINSPVIELLYEFHFLNAGDKVKINEVEVYAVIEPNHIASRISQEFFHARRVLAGRKKLSGPPCKPVNSVIGIRVNGIIFFKRHGIFFNELNGLRFCPLIFCITGYTRIFYSIPSLSVSCKLVILKTTQYENTQGCQ